jgi:hypothetical protein
MMWPESRPHTQALTLESLLSRTCPDPNSGCLLWTGPVNRAGYGIAKSGREQLAHRSAWRLTRGPISKGACILHRCDTPACINIDHLFLGSQADNVADMTRKGRRVEQIGELHGRAKLTAAQVVAARCLVAARARSVRSIAKELGVAHQVMRNAVHGKTWRGLP